MKGSPLANLQTDLAKGDGLVETITFGYCGNSPKFMFNHTKPFVLEPSVDSWKATTSSLWDGSQFLDWFWQNYVGPMISQRRWFQPNHHLWDVLFPCLPKATLSYPHDPCMERPLKILSLIISHRFPQLDIGIDNAEEQNWHFAEAFDWHQRSELQYIGPGITPHDSDFDWFTSSFKPMMIDIRSIRNPILQQRQPINR